MTESFKKALTYRDAGVDIDAGETLIEAIKPIAKSTNRPGVLSGLGGFGALFELPIDRYKRPVLVSGTDGVGTKLKLAIETGRHDTIGIDLVAMCANDIIVQGAEPLFFLDYLATGKLQPAVAESVIRGIGEGCRQAGVALSGGETAEMPGMYADQDYDLAGFCVGIVEKSKLIDGSTIQNNDTIIGLCSSGAHSNGYSLIRKVIETGGANLQDSFENTTLAAALLAPTRIYVKPLLKLIEALPVHGLAHITGGGLPGNVPRILPENTKAIVDSRSWQTPAIFDWLQQLGNIEGEEMYRTFNCGIGMAIVTRASDAEKAISILSDAGETAQIIGHIESASGSRQIEIIE